MKSPTMFSIGLCILILVCLEPPTGMPLGFIVGIGTALIGIGWGKRNE